MKSWIWQIVTIIICFIIMNVLNIPLWAFLLIASPILVFGLTYFSFIYSFRDTLEPQQIPEKGYENRLAELDRDYPRINYMQFERIDAFYLKIIPDTVVFIYKHRFEPIFLCDYHLGSQRSFDFITYFENDIGLTTTTSVSGGLSPRPAGEFLQVVEGHPMEVLLNEHTKGVYYLKYQGVNSIDIPIHIYRQKFMEDLFKSAKSMRSYSMWPMRLVYWTIVKRGKIHKRPIEEQLKLEIATFPENKFIQ